MGDHDGVQGSRQIARESRPRRVEPKASLAGGGTILMSGAGQPLVEAAAGDGDHRRIQGVVAVVATLLFVGGRSQQPVQAPMMAQHGGSTALGHLHIGADGGEVILGQPGDVASIVELARDELVYEDLALFIESLALGRRQMARPLHYLLIALRVAAVCLPGCPVAFAQAVLLRHAESLVHI